MSSTWSIVGQYRKWAEQCMTGDRDGVSTSTTPTTEHRRVKRRWQVRHITCRVQRHKHSGEVQNNKYVINWPRTRSGSFVPQIYVTAIGGGAGGAGALYEVSRESASCDLFASEHGTTVSCHRVIPTSPLNFAALGGASGGALVAMPLQCPVRGLESGVDESSIALSIAVEVGFGGDGGLSQVILEGGGRDGAPSHPQLALAQEAAKGTPGIASTVTVDGFHNTPPSFLSTPMPDDGIARHHQSPCLRSTHMSYHACTSKRHNESAHVNLSRSADQCHTSMLQSSVRELPRYQTFQSVDLSARSITNVAAIFQSCAPPAVGDLSRAPLARERSLQLGFVPPHDDSLRLDADETPWSSATGVPDYSGMPLPHSRRSALHTWHCAARESLTEFQDAENAGEADGNDFEDDAFHYIWSQGGAGAVAPYRLPSRLGAVSEPVAGDGGCGAAIPMFHVASTANEAYTQQAFTSITSSSSFFEPIRATRGADGIVDVYWLEEEEPIHTEGALGR